MERGVRGNGIDLLCLGTLLIQLVYLITVSIYAVQCRSQVDDFPNLSGFIEIRELDLSLSHFCFLLFNAALPQGKMYFYLSTAVANRTGDVGLCPTAAKKSSLCFSPPESRRFLHIRLHHGSSSPSRSTAYKHSSAWRQRLASSLVTFRLHGSSTRILTENSFPSSKAKSVSSEYGIQSVDIIFPQ